MATLGAHALTSNSHSLWRSSRAEYRYWWKRKFVLFCFAGLTVFHFVFVQNTDNKKSDGEKKIKKQESTARERRQKRSKKEVKKVLLASCRRVLYNLCESQPIFWVWILWCWPVRCVCVCGTLMAGTNIEYIRHRQKSATGWWWWEDRFRI